MTRRVNYPLAFVLKMGDLESPHMSTVGMDCPPTPPGSPPVGAEVPPSPPPPELGGSEEPTGSEEPKGSEEPQGSEASEPQGSEEPGESVEGKPPAGRVPPLPEVDFALWENSVFFPPADPPSPAELPGPEVPVIERETPVLFRDWTATPGKPKPSESRSTVTVDIESKIRRKQLAGYLRWYLTDSLEEEDVRNAVKKASNIDETTAVLKVQKLLKESEEAIEPPRGWTLQGLEESTGAQLLWQALEERLRAQVQSGPKRPSGIAPPKGRPPTKAMPKTSATPIPKTSGTPLPKTVPKASGARIPGLKPPPKAAPAASSGRSPAPKTPPKGPPRGSGADDSDDWGKWKGEREKDVPQDDPSAERLRKARKMVQDAKEKCRALYIQRIKMPPPPPPPPAA